MWDRMIMLYVVDRLVTWDRTRHLTFIGSFDDDGGNTLFKRIDVMWNSSLTEEPFLGLYSIKIHFNMLSLLFIEGGSIWLALKDHLIQFQIQYL